MNIGILYPSSNAHPSIGIDFMQGIKNYFKKNDVTQINIFSESIGFGGNAKDVNEKAEKLLIAENVDVLVAYVDLKVYEDIEPILKSSGKLIIIVSPGANYPDKWAPQTNIIHLTLQHAFLNWLTGKAATESADKNAAIASTFYDCGYRHIAAITDSFINNSGEIKFNYINNDRYDETFGILPLTDFLSFDKETNKLLCVFDSLPAKLFYSLLNEYDDAGRLKLFVSPMMLTGSALEAMEDGYNFSMEGFVAWDEQTKNDGNNFCEYYLEQNKTGPSQFSLLGWETGCIVERVYKNYKDDHTQLSKIIEGFSEIETPRGKLKLDKKTHHFLAPVIKCIIKNNSSKIEKEIIEDLNIEWEKFTTDSKDVVSSGWFNTYLCY